MKAIINDKYREYEDFVRSLPTGGFDSADSRVLHDKRNCVKLFMREGVPVVVKRFKPPHILNRVIYTFFRGSKAYRAYTNAMELGRLGVNTPAPIAYLEVKKGGLLCQSWLVTEYSDWESVWDIVEHEHPQRERLMDALMHYTVRLHRLGVCHIDYNASNILFRRVGEEYEFSLIDVNRMIFGKLSRARIIESLARFSNRLWLREYIASHYPMIAGWDVDKFRHDLFAWRERYERNRNLRRSIIPKK